MTIDSRIKNMDVPALQSAFRTAEPFRWVAIDSLLDEEFVQRVSAAYPSFDESRKSGREFSAVNERRKVQITDSAQFPGAVHELHGALSAPQFLAALEEITGIAGLIADPLLVGGGMHVTGSQGRLDVHVDFNYMADRALYRRLNILVYMNPSWRAAWGGEIELWDRGVQNRRHAFLPAMNRCVLFETSDISYHGVSPVTCPPGVLRKSFAAYYYTKEAPPGWTGTPHDTRFRARPHELVRANLLMPLERAQRRAWAGARALKKQVKAMLGS